MRGGLCHANILGCVIFAGMCGSAVADAAGLGTVEIKAMKDAGYDAETAGAITAASATIGPIIPPSLPMIIYGVAAETSIGALFLAGVVPGLLMAVALMMMVRAIAMRTNCRAHPFPGVRRAVARVPPRVLGADDAGAAVRRHAVGRFHADRSGRGRGRLRAGARPRSSTAISASDAAAAHPRHGRDDRRRDGAGDDGGAARLLPFDVAACRRSSAPR